MLSDEKIVEEYIEAAAAKQRGSDACMELVAARDALARLAGRAEAGRKLELGLTEHIIDGRSATADGLKLGVADLLADYRAASK